MAEIYVPGAIDIMGSANQMMQFRNSQQAQQANALQMQYAAEDRARADQARKAAAGNALAERAALSKALEYSVVGGAGPEQPNLGRAADTLAKQGRFGLATDISKLQSQFANQQKAELEATGQGLTNVKTGVETDEKRADVTKKAIEIQRQSFDYAQDLPTLKALITASYTPGHPLSEFHAINGVTLDQALKSIDDLAAQGVPFETIRERMSQGASKAAENIAARGLVAAQTESAKATTAKTVAETAQVGKPAAAVPTNLAKLITERNAFPEGSADRAKFDAAIDKELNIPGVAGTEKERAFAILAQGTVNPSIVNTPAYRAALAIASQSEIKSVIGPNGEVKYVSVAPSLPSWVVLPKENGVAQQTFAGAVAQRQTTPNAFTNALTQAGGGAQVNNLVAPPAAVPATAPATATAPAAAPADNRPDANVVARTETDANGDVRGFNKYGEEINVKIGAGKPSAEVEKQRTANKRITFVINELEEILKPGGLVEKATGSALGAGRDALAAVGGFTTEGSAAIAALEPIYDIVLKTVPRFEGPQSDADVKSYKAAAGKLADPFATWGQKQAAGKTILRLMKLYAGQFDILPDGANTSASGGDVDSSNPLLK